MNNHKTAIAFGAVIRELRLKRKLTQEQLSFECGVARAYISQLELGNQLPSLETMLMLSRGLKIPFGHLAAFVDEKLKDIPDR